MGDSSAGGELTVSNRGAEGDAGSALEAPLLAIALEAAQAAGALLLDRFNGPAQDVRAKSTPTDLVSEADLEAERAIRAIICEQRPGDAILGEEGGNQSGDGVSSVHWLVDPLDGTINYLFGIPQWSVSIACLDRDGGIAGVVLDPVRNEIFAATRSGQPTLNGETIVGSSKQDLATAMVATGFAYDASVRASQAEVLTRVLPLVRDIRRLGSAALDLAWTACGRCDAYYERGLNPWDLAAGALICQRAGLEVRTLQAKDDLPAGLLVAPPAIAELLSDLVGP